MSIPVKKHTWTFLTNHTHVLICIVRDPDRPLREVAQEVGITERAVQKIIADLEHDGVLTRERVGRCNQYTINPSHHLHHRIESHCTVAELLRFVLKRTQTFKRTTTPKKQSSSD